MYGGTVDARYRWDSGRAERDWLEGIRVFAFTDFFFSVYTPTDVYHFTYTIENQLPDAAASRAELRVKLSRSFEFYDAEKKLAELFLSVTDADSR